MKDDNKPINTDSTEAVPLARKFVASFEGFVRFYQETYELSREEAIEQARSGVNTRARILDAPADQVSWIDLGQLGEEDPEASLAVWGRVRDEARDELESGHRAAEVVSKGYDFGPLDRARFLEVRAALHEEWQPSVGSEMALIDMLAQIQIAWEDWLARHMLESRLKGISGKYEQAAQREGGWLPERISEAEALQLSATMADRFNRMYLRTLRALRDLRRMSPQIVVQSGGQVNVGEKQINVAKGVSEA